jgi:hypothetical protein
MTEQAAIQAIVKIVKEQQELERHQRQKKASAETIQDSMVYAYSDIVRVLAPFLEDSDV